MRNVTRSKAPPSLRKNRAQWTRDLLQAIAQANQKNTKVAETYYDKYKQRDVRDALMTIYSGFCCYCEARIGVVAFEHIEHRRPKKKFPQDTFNWRNLHLACPKCNQAKGEKWDSGNEILDAAGKEDIAAHLTYRLFEKTGLCYYPMTDRGETTIKHTNLRRQSLLENLSLIHRRTLILVAELNAAIARGRPGSDTVKIELNELCKDEHGTVVQWTMNTFLRA
jgi:uncharacterized protein (TIGR02646 family)